jgi:hypothetical protein
VGSAACLEACWRACCFPDGEDAPRYRTVVIAVCLSFVSLALAKWAQTKRKNVRQFVHLKRISISPA